MTEVYESKNLDQHPVERKAGKFPSEIRDAIHAFDGDTEQAIIATLLNQGPLAFSELKQELSIHSQTLSNGLKSLQRGGLVDRRATEKTEDKYDAYYEVSEYGERFIDHLLESLGSVDSFNRPGPEPKYEPVDHIQCQDSDSTVFLEPYHREDQEDVINH